MAAFFRSWTLRPVHPAGWLAPHAERCPRGWSGRLSWEQGLGTTGTTTGQGAQQAAPQQVLLVTLTLRPPSPGREVRAGQAFTERLILAGGAAAYFIFIWTHAALTGGRLWPKCFLNASSVNTHKGP